MARSRRRAVGGSSDRHGSAAPSVSHGPDAAASSTALRDLIADRIRDEGPITAEAFIDLALYHPAHGYYATAARRSGRSGDFFTSVDVGPLFGELLAVQFAEMWQRMDCPATFDLVEAAAGTGRLARDILDAALAADPAFHAAIRLHLVETSLPARRVQREVLGPHTARLASSGPDLPTSIDGVIVANELLDALPPHAVVMRADGLRERRVDLAADAFVEVEGPPSTPALEAYLARVGAKLEDGWRAEINLAAEQWVADAAQRLARGFLLIVDYGREAAELYSAPYSGGTLRTFFGHAIDPAADAWLREPGVRDITSHVDLTAVRLAAEREGLQTLAVQDQTYFLLGLGAAERLDAPAGGSVADLKRRLALKTLLLPGGMGSTHKVLTFGRRVTGGRLQAASAGGRLT